jgi:16S rRNA (guanine966-N2)-methyltransferase
VTRIISGIVGSLRLKPPAKSTRPTSDRVKESLFSTLESMNVIEGATVLDLYAGTGALGLEAASRGAKSVALVESNAAAVKVCKENLQNVKAGLQRQDHSTEIELYHEPVEKFLKRGLSAELVFIDPPYELSNEELTLTLEKLAGQGFLIVLERSSRSKKPTLPQGFSYLTEKNYGDTSVYLITARSAG